MNERNRLVVNNMNLVRYLVNKHYPSYKRDEDILQIGYIGLIKAAESYDPELGFAFSTYASTIIMNEIKMEFRNIQKSPSTISIDTIIVDDGTMKLEDVLGSEDLEVFDLTPFMNRLTDLERTMVYMAIEGSRKSDIARELNVSRSYVTRIFQNIRKKWDLTYKTKN